jgi:regulatory protein
LTDSADDAKRYSLRLLSYRGRSESEMREKLGKKDFPEEVISRTIGHLKQSGYLDDGALAVNLKRQAVEKKLLGYEGARTFMLKRGLPPEVIRSTLDYDEDGELENIHKLVDKKLKSMGNYLTESDKKKLWNFLARRGYSFEIIRKAIKETLKFREEAEG